MTTQSFDPVLPTLENDAYQVVCANYSLHHLQRPQKLELLSEINRVLHPSGMMIWSDVVLNEGEDREAYLARLAAVIRDWQALTLPEREQAVQHIYDSDFPESLSWMQAEMSRLGWTQCEEVLRDPTFGSWIFRRN